jgi:hypothetical protein
MYHNADGTISSFALGDRLERGGHGRVPRAGANGEGCTVSVIKSPVRC